jgi:hypothetical protein
MNNSEINFSIIYPTAGDKKKIKRNLDSIERTTGSKDKIEVLIAIDEGRKDLIDYINSLGYSYIIKCFERPITDNFSDDYYNWLANRTIGDNVWGFNDDVFIRTQNWDDIILKKISEYRWSVYLVDTTDATRGTVNIDFCCFPLVSRKAINEIGFFMYPQVRIYPADKILYELYNKAGRIINAREVILQSHYVEETKSPRLWKIFQEDLKNGKLKVDVSRELMILLKTGQNDLGPKRESKLSKIIKILKEK